ncbi:hypothetical protein PAEPH01_1621 [Pancytospora epiphaga]|nr:hypothetical protein PAEPH01_1621 [Pancytospora epiphaga]
MGHKTIEIDTGKIQNSIPRIFNDIRNTLILKRVDLEELHASTFQVVITVMVLGVSNYLAYIIGTLLRLKIINALISVLSPIASVLAMLYLAFYAYVAGNVYTFLLSDDNREIKNYMYVVMLGTVHLPFAIIIVNFTEGILKGLFGNIFKIFFFLCFGSIALFSEYFCRKNITLGRHFDNELQKILFISVSFFINMGAFLVFFPLFYIH